MATLTNNGICRCCASEGTFKDVRSVYVWMGEEEIYADMLKECFDITLSAQEGLSGVCEVCVTQLRNARNFKRQVLDIEDRFRRHLFDDLLNRECTPAPHSLLVKMEVQAEGHSESEPDDVDDEDYTPEFKEVPVIKREASEEPKAKRRAKTTAKKKEGAAQKAPKPKTRDIREKHMPEMKKQWHNLTTLLKYSNATPFKDRNDAGFICAYCFKTFPDPNVLRTHTKDDHVKEKPTYKAGSGMSSFVAFLDIVDLKCTLCDAPMDSLKTLTDHLTVVHEKKLYTEMVDYFQPFKLTGEQQMACCLCKESFHNMKLLMQHMNVHFRNFICTTCGAGFVNSFRLNRHETTHQKKKSSYRCGYCALEFPAESKRKAHVNTEHKGIAGDSVCQICKARFKNYYRKTRHMVQVHNVERMKCEVCDKKFNIKSNLDLHMRSVHLKERPYECSVCSMGFFIKRHMLGHYLATHTNERSFKCELCGKAYATQNSKRKHMKKNHGVTKGALAPELQVNKA